MYKRRGYVRDVPQDLVRDYKLFAISCEGSKREHDYFQIFEHLSRKIKVDIIEDKVNENDLLEALESKSAPRWVLERAIKYIEQEGLNDDDDLWLIMDVDRWEREQFYAIFEFCKGHPNYHVVLSNPCFEVWLYFHKRNNIEVSGSTTCKDFKNEIAKFEKGGYNPLLFLLNIEDAIKNSKNSDQKNDLYIPGFKNTNVYHLAEALLAIVTEKDLKEFINKKIPRLIEEKKKIIHGKRK